MSKSCLKAFLSGRVQGVGMRYFAKGEADNLGLTGYVRNLADGKVEIVAEGEKENLLKLYSIIDNSGVGNIESISAQWLDYEGKYSDFEIRY